MPEELSRRGAIACAMRSESETNQNLQGLPTVAGEVLIDKAGAATENENEDGGGAGVTFATPAPSPATTTKYGGVTTYTSGGMTNYNRWNQKSASGFVGLSNQGATCYLNSLLQSLYMTPELRVGMYRWLYDDARYEAVGECIPAQLQRLFVMLQTSEERDVETGDLTSAFGWNDADAFQQQDVSELYVMLLDALESKFAGTPQASLVKALYNGSYEDGVTCKECNNGSGAGATDFTTLDIAIRQFGDPEPIKTLEEGLHKFFEAELLSGANQYSCETCAKNCDAMKGLKLTKVPYILNVQLKRFDYDWERDARIKVDDEVSYPFVLDMAQFLDVEGAAAEGGPPEPTPGGREFGQDGAPISYADAKTALARPDKKLEYELFAIMIHSGSALGGHYYAYIKSFADNKWFEFNDSTITEISEEDTKKAYGGLVTTTRMGGYGAYSSAYQPRSATAYMLMYRRVDPLVNVRTV
eukprot:SAG22_NODE_3285_length_1805_cov_2.285463_1_plen_470_part_10